MNLKNIVAVSGLPGLLELVTTKSNGLILQDPETKKTKFFSVRMHQFTPLETVGIYTMTDTIDLKVIFQNMMDLGAEPVSVKASNQELYQYFEKVLPEFDKDRVYPGDIKKVIKWYNFCNDKGYLQKEEDSTDPVTNEESSSVSE